MPVATSDLIGWIGGTLGWDVTQETGAPLYVGPYVPDEPDVLVVITPSNGAGYLREGATDMCGFQARVRGPQGGDGSPEAQEAAEALAYALDALIFGAPYPVALPSGRIAVHAHRLGGPPAPLSGNPDDADRFTLTTQYLIEVSN